MLKTNILTAYFRSWKQLLKTFFIKNIINIKKMSNFAVTKNTIKNKSILI